MGVLLLATLLVACSIRPSASPSPLPPVDLCSGDSSCSVKAGTYSPTLFRPAIRFTLDDGWSEELRVVDCITLLRKDTEELFFVSGVAALGSRPDDLIGFANRQELTILDQAPIDVANRHGLELDVTTTSSRALFSVASMSLGLEPGQQARLIGVPAGDRMLVIVIRTDTSNFGQFLIEAQRMTPHSSSADRAQDASGRRRAASLRLCANSFIQAAARRWRA
jgi:hypothetical protein